MNQPPDEPDIDIDLEIDKVSSLISAARRHMAEDKMVNLSALEGKVQALCGSITSAPGEDAKRIIAAVKAVMDDLNQLAQELTTQQNKFKGRAGEGDPGQAAKAYSKTDEKDS